MSSVLEQASSISPDLFAGIRVPELYRRVGGADNQIDLSLVEGRLVNSLNISANIKRGLIDYAESWQKLVFLGPSEGFNLEQGNSEGRGLYIDINQNGCTHTFFLKGCGSPEVASRRMGGESYPGFILGNSPLYDPDTVDYPRLIGAMSLPGCRTQFAIALSQLEQFINVAKIESFETLIESGFPIPLAVCRYGELSRELHAAASESLKESADAPQISTEFGAILTKVSNSRRFNPGSYSINGDPEKLVALGKGIAEGLKIGWVHRCGAMRPDNYFLPYEDGVAWFTDQVDMISLPILSAKMSLHPKYEKYRSEGYSISEINGAMIDDIIATGLEEIIKQLVTRDPEIKKLNNEMKWAYQSAALTNVLAGMLGDDPAKREIRLLARLFNGAVIEKSEHDWKNNTGGYLEEMARFVREEIVPRKYWVEGELDTQAVDRVTTIFQTCGAMSLDQQVLGEFEFYGSLLILSVSKSSVGQEHMRARIEEIQDIMHQRIEIPVISFDRIQEDLMIEAGTQQTQIPPSSKRERRRAAEEFVRSKRPMFEAVSRLIGVCESGVKEPCLLDFLDNGVGRELFERDAVRQVYRAPDEFGELVAFKRDILLGKCFDLRSNEIDNFLNGKFEVPKSLPEAVKTLKTEEAQIKKKIKRLQGGLVNRVVDYSYNSIEKILQTPLTDPLRQQMKIQGVGDWSTFAFDVLLNTRASPIKGFAEPEGTFLEQLTKVLKAKIRVPHRFSIKQTFFEVPHEPAAFQLFIKELIYSNLWCSVFEVPNLMNQLRNSPVRSLSQYVREAKDPRFLGYESKSAFDAARVWKFALDLPERKISTRYINRLRREIESTFLELLTSVCPSFLIS